MKKFQIVRSVQAVVVIAVVATLMTGLIRMTYAVSGSLTFTPSSGSGTVGSTLTITLHENSGTDAAIGVDTVINYPASLLSFVSASTVAPFSVGPPDSTGSGTVQIVRGAYSGVTGDQVVSVLVFNVLAAGNATVSLGPSSISSASGNSNLLTASPSSTYSLTAPATGGGSPTPAPTPTPTPATPVPTPVAKPTTTTSGTGTPKSTTVTVTPSGGSAVAVPDNGAVAVNTPTTTVQPTTVQSEGVNKVEYYIGNKLVGTETKAPYSYNVSTGKLGNGTYDLVTKTYYANGTIKKSTQHIIVKNAAQKSAAVPVSFGLLAIVLLIGGVGVMTLFLRRSPKALQLSNTTNPLITTSPPPTTVQTAIPTANSTPPLGSTEIIAPQDSTNTNGNNETKI